MALTKEDLRDFASFAHAKLENGGAASLVELASEWEAQRQTSHETGAGHQTIDARTLELLAKAFPEVHDERQLRQALARVDGVTTAELLSKAASAAEKASHG